MSNYAVGLKDLLETASVGTFNVATGWGIFIGKQSEKLDTAITIYNTGGLPPNPKWLIDNPTAQVMIRGAANGYEAAHSKAVECKDALLGLPSQTLNGDRWDAINITGDLNELGFDEKNRPLFSINLRMIIEPAASLLTNRDPLPA